MSSTLQRFTKVSAMFLVLATGALAGCAVPTGAGAPQLAAGSASSAGYVICSGGRASRFPEQEQVGRVCRPALELHAIY